MLTGKNEFLDYVYSFYGRGGVYPMRATKRQIRTATNILIERFGDSVEFDSVDRERVRDILIEKFGLAHPPAALKLSLLA